MSNIVHLFSRKNNFIDEPLSTSEVENGGFQMSLPFSAPHVLYLISNNIETIGEDFLIFLSQKHVAAFFDLRFSPRLDFIASTRAKAFAQLKEVRVAYYDVLGRLGISSPNLALDERFDILKDIVAATEKTLKNGEPCLMMFDNHPLMREYQRSMVEYFEVREIDGAYIAETASEYHKLQM